MRGAYSNATHQGAACDAASVHFRPSITRTDTEHLFTPHLVVCVCVCVCFKVSRFSSLSLNVPFAMFTLLAGFSSIFLNSIIYLSHYSVVRSALVGFVQRNAAKLRRQQT